MSWSCSDPATAASAIATAARPAAIVPQRVRHGWPGTRTDRDRHHTSRASSHRSARSVTPPLRVRCARPSATDAFTSRAHSWPRRTPLAPLRGVFSGGPGVIARAPEHATHCAALAGCRRPHASTASAANTSAAPGSARMAQELRTGDLFSSNNFRAMCLKRQHGGDPGGRQVPPARRLRTRRTRNRGGTTTCPVSARLAPR